MDDIPIQYLTSSITVRDEVPDQYTVGYSRGQQAWEHLAILVALRLWRSFWGVKSENVGVAGRQRIRPHVGLEAQGHQRCDEGYRTSSGA